MNDQRADSISVCRVRTQILETPLGKFQAAWSNEGLRSFEFPRDTKLANTAGTGADLTQADSFLPQMSSELKQAVDEYFCTGVFQWELDLLDWQSLGPFQQNVLRACYEIPSGTTCTYGQLARRVGSPQAARAVGGTMAGNRWPLLIPCHRVIGGTGKLTGYSGAGGIQTKQWLLDLERRLTQPRGVELELLR